jgi:hypothetical protein
MRSSARPIRLSIASVSDCAPKRCEVRRGDDADDVGDVERRECDLVELRREIEHHCVSSAAREIDRLLHGAHANSSASSGDGGAAGCARRSCGRPGTD